MSIALASLLEDVADGLFFTTVTVQDELNAYLVFETLNARGVQLSSPDLLKNYLMSIFAQTATSQNLEEIEISWSKIIEQLGEANFTAFLRSYHGMQDRLRHKKGLFRFIKEKIKRSEEVSPYILSIKKFAPIFSALQKPESNFWTDYDHGRYSAAKNSLRTLKLFNIKTPLSLLMIGYDRFEPQDFIKLLKWIEVISIRYNVICNKTSKDQESLYNQLANKIHASELKISDLKKSLQLFYPEDNEFVASFSTKSMLSRRSPNKILFFLKKIETHLSKGEETSENLSLEHILPYHPNDGWQESFGREMYAEATDRIGNMALLPENQNRDVGQSDFQLKKKILLKSNIELNKKIGSYGEWNMDSLSSYQLWLAQQAKTVWNIDF